MSYDVVIVGAGHNGLVAACYLAEAQLKVLVLESAAQVGGAAVTEELIPGFKLSTASYSFSLFRPDIFKDLSLGEHGLSFYPKQPQMFVPLLDGRHFFIWRQTERTIEELSKISKHDADAYPRYNAFWDEAIALLRPMFESDDPPRLSEVEQNLRSKGREDVWRLAVVGSVADTVSEFFESDEVRGAFATQGLIGTALGPRDPGTAWVMAFHYMGGELNGADGTWAYVRGGMGSVTTALLAAATSRGVEVRTGCTVKAIVTEASGVRGVLLEDGELIAADTVLSNLEPKRTAGLIDEHVLPDDLAQKLRDWKTPGSAMKMNVALSALPDFSCLPGSAPGPQHCGTIEIAPSIDHIETAWRDASGGAVSRHPFMEVFMQSATDPTLVEGEGHVLSAFAQYAPAEASATEWEAMREDASNAIIETIAAYAPNFKELILASEVLGPADLEARFGLTGGNIFHGEITPEQSFGERFPYRWPVKGLYLCGSGASPGGGVMGAPGRNCARIVLNDLK